MRHTLVIGTDSPIGLTLVRELGEHGVAVHAMGRHRGSLGGQSRYARRFSLQPDGPLAEWLPDFAAQHDIEGVMAVGEETLVELAALHGTIRNCTIIAPKSGPLAQVLDKTVTLAAARRAGVDVPDSWQPHGIAGRKQKANTLTYPSAVKWADPVAVVRRLEAAGLELEKVEYAEYPDQLVAILSKYDRLGIWPLVQEYIGGYGMGQMLHIHNGKVTLAFQHQRLREWPPSGGVSTYCAAVPMELHASQRALSEALLQEIGWEGPAMVEYRFDPATGRTSLMEVNGRFWGSIPLAYHSGVYFAWESWRCSMEVPFLQQGCVKPRRARYMVPDAKHLAHQLRSPGVSATGKLALLARFFGRFLDLRTCYYVWSWRDPRPFAADMMAMLKKAMHRETIAPTHRPQLRPVSSKLP